MKNKTLLTMAAVLAVGASSLFAAQTVPLTPDFIVEPNGGLNSANFTASGWAYSSGNVNAPGCTLNIGSQYSGTATYFGPTRYAEFSYTPTVSGTYQIDLAWPSSAGEHDTAVNLYTGAAVGSSTDAWGNGNAPDGIIVAGQMDMYYVNVGVWNTFATTDLTAGTLYHVGIYGGHVAVSPETRVCIGAVGFSMVPEPSTALLGLLGGLGLMGWINRRRTA